MLVCALAGEVSAQSLAGGSITTNGQSVSVTLRGDPDVRNVAMQVTGTWTGTLTFQGSVDGSTFVSVLVTIASSGSTATSTTSNGVFTLANSGFRVVRVTATAAMTGTAVVTLNEGYAGGGGAGGAGGGDASAANQTTQITHLSAIETATEAAQASLADVATDTTHDSAASATGPQDMKVAAAFGTLPSAVTAADAVRAAADLQGVSYVRSPNNPCDGATVTTLAISAAADAVLVSASASNRIYICKGAILANAAEIFAIWEGTGSTCGTSTAALVGSTTIANGVSLAANGGFPLDFIRGNSTNVDICLHLNTTNRVTGYITYVLAP